MIISAADTVATATANSTKLFTISVGTNYTVITEAPLGGNRSQFYSSNVSAFKLFYRIEQWP